MLVTVDVLPHEIASETSDIPLTIENFSQNSCE